jgi:hypothetical protein
MSCTYKAYRVKNDIKEEYTAVLVTNPENGLSLSMPNTEDFDKIRFHIATTSHPGGTLFNAYAVSERFRIIPPEEYTSCIKTIYQMPVYDTNKRIYIDKPVGDWIYDEACKCLSKTEEGRMDLGDGFVVPTLEEQKNIIALMSDGKTFHDAIQAICPKFTPPMGAIYCIEDKIKSTNLRFYDIYRVCRASYVSSTLPATTPSTSPGITLPGTIPIPTKTNYLWYAILGLAVLLIVSKK